MQSWGVIRMKPKRPMKATAVSRRNLQYDFMTQSRLWREQKRQRAIRGKRTQFMYQIDSLSIFYLFLYNSLVQSFRKGGALIILREQVLDIFQRVIPMSTKWKNIIILFASYQQRYRANMTSAKSWKNSVLSDTPLFLSMFFQKESYDFMNAIFRNISAKERVKQSTTSQRGFSKNIYLTSSMYYSFMVMRSAMGPSTFANSQGCPKEQKDKNLRQFWGKRWRVKFWVYPL